MHFKKYQDDLLRKPNNNQTWVDKGSEFYNGFFKKNG